MEPRRETQRDGEKVEERKRYIEWDTDMRRNSFCDGDISQQESTEKNISHPDGVYIQYTILLLYLSLFTSLYSYTQSQSFEWRKVWNFAIVEYRESTEPKKNRKRKKRIKNQNTISTPLRADTRIHTPFIRSYRNKTTF